MNPSFQQLKERKIFKKVRPNKTNVLDTDLMIQDLQAFQQQEDNQQTKIFTKVKNSMTNKALSFLKSAFDMFYEKPDYTPVKKEKSHYFSYEEQIQNTTDFDEFSNGFNNGYSSDHTAAFTPLRDQILHGYGSDTISTPFCHDLKSKIKSFKQTPVQNHQFQCDKGTALNNKQKWYQSSIGKSQMLSTVKKLNKNQHVNFEDFNQYSNNSDSYTQMKNNMNNGNQIKGKVQKTYFEDFNLYSNNSNTPDPNQETVQKIHQNSILQQNIFQKNPNPKSNRLLKFE